MTFFCIFYVFFVFFVAARQLVCAVRAQLGGPLEWYLLPGGALQQPTTLLNPCMPCAGVGRPAMQCVPPSAAGVRRPMLHGVQYSCAA